MIQANAKIEWVSSKKFDEVLAHQKSFSNKSGLGYTRESSSSVKASKDMKFVKANEPMVEITTVEKVKVEKKRNVTDQRLLTKPPNQSMVKLKGKGKSLPKSQRDLKTQHFCHHCEIQGHTRPNCHKLQALKNSNAQRSRGPRHAKGIGLLSNQKVKKVIVTPQDLKKKKKVIMVRFLGPHVPHLLHHFPTTHFQSTLFSLGWLIHSLLSFLFSSFLPNTLLFTLILSHRYLHATISTIFSGEITVSSLGTSKAYSSLLILG